MGLFAQVDINEDGKSFVTVKISRDKIGSAVDLANMAFGDRGGDSYLYFDGVNETVTIIRNSYIKRLSIGKKRKRIIIVRSTTSKLGVKIIAKDAL